MESDEETRSSAYDSSDGSDREERVVLDPAPTRNLFKFLDDIFGADYYRKKIENTNPGFWPVVPYRDAGYISDHTYSDNVIISQVLSKLDYDDLNMLNEEVSTFDMLITSVFPLYL